MAAASSRKAATSVIIIFPSVWCNENDIQEMCFGDISRNMQNIDEEIQFFVLDDAVTLGRL